jgi:phosphatidylglycerol lysyltransferase
MVTLRQSVWRHIIAVLVGLMGIANILSAILVRVVARQRFLRAFLPFEIVQGSRYLAVVAGLALLALGRGLWRGKRGPWALAIALLLGSAVFHVLKGLDIEETTAALALTALLLWQRDTFTAGPDRPAVSRAFGALLLSIFGLLVYALVGSFMLRTQFAPPVTAVPALEELGARLMLNIGPLHPLSRRALWFLQSFSVIGVAMLAYLLGAFLHPIVAAPAAPSEREHALNLLHRYADSSLSYFALMPDKSLYFGREVEGLIAFRVAADVAVVCGDPIVAPDNLQRLLAEFMQHCTHQGWEICLYEVQAVHLHVYQALGFRTLKIGEDAWIDLPNFTLKGKPIADVRHACSKIERDGLGFELLEVQNEQPITPATVRESCSDHHQGMDTRPAALWEQMQAIVAKENRGDFELQFSIGRLPPVPDPEARYTLAVGPDRNCVLGFCSWLPIFSVNGWALDVMQRAAEAPNGTMEYLIAQSLLCFQRQGATWASLGMAPLADADLNDEERSLLQRGVRFLYEHPRVNHLYRYKSLFFFKRKFVPVWRSAYLAYTSPLSLPRILFAVLKVHLPGIGPSMITDFLLEQGEKGIDRWREWLRTRYSARVKSGDDAGSQA